MSEPAPASTAVLAPDVLPWDLLPLVGFDLETTGPEPEDARIVQAAILDSGPEASRHEWLVDPGVEIPAGATAVHGISTERARLEGAAAPGAVQQIADTLTAYWLAGRSVVIYNAQYDLTVLAHEMARHGLGPLTVGTVVDPLVIWRETEPYRKGKKRLSDAADRFGVDPGDAHDAVSDARAAIGVAAAVCDLAELGGLAGVDLAQRQGQWHRKWAEGFASWLVREGKDPSDVRADWPLRPVETTA